MVWQRFRLWFSLNIIQNTVTATYILKLASIYFVILEIRLLGLVSSIATLKQAIK